MQTFVKNNKSWLRPGLILLYTAILILPGYVFFSQRGGLDFYQTDNFKTFASLIFPLFGLYAFTLVWAQSIIGMNMYYFSRLFGSAVSFHRSQGLLALVFATTHVFSIQYIYGMQQYIGFKFLTEDTRIFAFFGAIAFYLLILTIVVALFRRTKILRRAWRYIHYINYAIFILVLVHSRNLGSDIQGTVLNYLWHFYLLTFVASFAFRLFRGFAPRKIVQTAST